ncbi:MAG TPA: HupE/UreJ family protein [Candidatus Kapabacteria bacterium]|nr:HupE/UreJ family protein [Candidatus Kapabacteria bacterium]
MNLFGTFFQLGFEHILTGYDHLLFLLALIIVTKETKSILSVISAFTIAHSTTLILSALEIISLPPVLTESLIALSIVYVGIENIVRSNTKSRWIVAASFGLIHGAGFSGHLTEILKGMLGSGNIWMPLIGFNIGIEAGQVVVIAIALPLLALVKKYGKEHQIVIEISRVIACVGAVLLVWRAFPI